MCSFLRTLFCQFLLFAFFFFNDTATTEIYTLSLHDALPISIGDRKARIEAQRGPNYAPCEWPKPARPDRGMRHAHRSEEHTSELQSLAYLVCRLLLEKKKKKKEMIILATHPDRTTH